MALRLPAVYAAGQPQQLQSGDSLQIPAGTASAGSWPNVSSGTVLSSPVAGTIDEYDGTAFYDTIDATSGRGQRCVQQIYRTTSDGSAVGGSGIQDLFPANSSFPTVLNGIYLLFYNLWFLKTTAGTVTFTLTNTQAYTNIAARYLGTTGTGQGAAGTSSSAGIDTSTTAATALPATSSLSTGVDHHFIIWATAECGTAGNIRLRVTPSAGSVTLRRGSYYTAQRVFAGNVGTFVA